MYVSPEIRGLGVGKELLSKAINQAKSIESIEKLNLIVVTTNESAKKLYTRLGFEIFGMEKHALIINNNYYDEEYMVLFLNK